MAFASDGRIVVEGRDIGTVVAPDARLKVYLTAAPDTRAHRRSEETAADLHETAADRPMPTGSAYDLARRDALDSTRETDPLAQAPDAVELDTTGLSIDEVVARLLTLLGGAG